jgi:cytochrome c biogenesis protein CcmG, thiol:disulfide interchange protein DsbE
MSLARLRLVAQICAVGFVASLLVLLVWKVTREEQRTGIAKALSLGQPVAAPAFDLPRLDTEGRVSLASLKGKPAIINFWASWCKPCEEEVPVLEATWREHRDDGLVVLGIDSQDFKGDARTFAKENGMTYPIVHDGPGGTMRSYDLTGLPETYFLDRDGKLVCGHIIGGVHVNDEIEGKFRECVEQVLRS